ncbi:Carbohydrate sulfotransferase 1 [Stylophora pistillata]|uniref:Carbohydrate sulfotransferase 1 n=1 Tax=Stylophora pistillata TaxID=50429 RepID=A0A2B4SAP9_STYPI|nr:Carbohydrate sulfotransferase 1 [Stylophora pistillata]
MLVVSISLLIGVFVFNILLVNQRPRFVEKDEKGVIPENLDETLKFFEDKSEKIPVFAQPKKKKRQNLIIVAHGRSGSTFLGNIFNNHPSVFYLFEPYQTVERLVPFQPRNSQDYRDTAFGWMKGIFRCDFVSSTHVDDLQSYYRKEYPANYNPFKSLTLLSPPFCIYNTTDRRWSLESCPPLDRDTMDDSCKTQYSMTVLKVLISRMPDTNLKQLLTICDTDQFDCKFIFLVRDPRGIIPSSKAVGFYGDNDQVLLNGTQRFSQEICDATYKNLNIIRYLGSQMKKRFMLLRYEDLAVNPMEMLPKLLDFAGLPEDESLTRWLYLASHSPETENEQTAARWRQDSKQGAERWRWKISINSPEQQPVEFRRVDSF